MAESNTSMYRLPRRPISVEGLDADVPRMSRDVSFLVIYLTIMSASNNKHKYTSKKH
jgi:hypothetical protein